MNMKITGIVEVSTDLSEEEFLDTLENELYYLKDRMTAEYKQYKEKENEETKDCS